MSWLDYLWNLPALPSLALVSVPIECAVIWLVVKVRRTVGKSGALMNIMPDLDEIGRELHFTEEEVRVAIKRLTAKAILNEVKLMRAALARGEH